LRNSPLHQLQPGGGCARPPRAAQHEATEVEGIDLVSLGLLVVLVPVFWFPWRVPILTLLALPLVPLVWLFRRRRGKSIAAATGLEWPLVGLLLASCVSSMAVVDWQLGLPKLLGIALAAATFVTVSRSCATDGSVVWTLRGTALILLATVTIGLLGTDWSNAKFPQLDILYQRLPAVLHGFVPNGVNGELNPNELAGMIVLLAPLSITQVLAACASACTRRTLSKSNAVWCAINLTASLCGLGVLVLTQSRTGLLGMGVSLVVIAAIVVRRIWKLSPGRTEVRAAAALALVVVSAGSILVAVWILSGWLKAGPGPDTFASRQELWSRAFAMIQDFPLTGIGPGQFSPDLQALYPSFILPRTQFVPHAHNLYLAYATELGLPGLGAFLILEVRYMRSCLQGLRAWRGQLGWAAAGLLSAMLGFLAYGLTDAIGPGARGGLVLWIGLAVGAALPRATTK
jgi:hypothetical protein